MTTLMRDAADREKWTTEAAWSGEQKDSCIYSHYCDITPALTLRCRKQKHMQRWCKTKGGAEYSRYDNSFLNRWVNENCCCFAEEKIPAFKPSRCRADLPREAGRRKNSLWRVEKTREQLAPAGGEVLGRLTASYLELRSPPPPPPHVSSGEALSSSTQP